MLATLRESTPLVHCMTNYVAMNSTANLLLATGASPAMLHAPEEVAEFTAIAGALSINIGTLSTPWAESMQLAARTAKETGTPWVLDPVAVGATAFRQQVCTALLAHRPNVIRANASEVMALTGLASQGRGVDATTTTEDAAQAAIKLAQQQCCIVAMTGETDFITNGTHHYRLTGGHALMPRVTTLGCGLSALVAGFWPPTRPIHFRQRWLRWRASALPEAVRGSRPVGRAVFRSRYWMRCMPLPLTISLLLASWRRSMPFDLSLYLVTDAALCAETGLEATVEAAVKGGVTMVQLRDKHASDESMIAQATRLKALLEGSGVPLIINDRLNVAIASGADGLHVGQSDTAVQEARAALGPQAILGLSINTLAQLRDAPIALLDYVGLGPIFATASKQDHARPIGFEGLAELVRACPLPSVAIGGLKAQHAAQVSAAGAQGMAVISAICGQPDPYRAALAFRAS
ncbi:hydroxyethylthiazole kinase [Vreelandella aquamarina]|nr:hydroxyethylthiazole kinase [Halomonas axialensis]